jgi:hypothetical protein
MKSLRRLATFFSLVGLSLCGSHALAQTPGALYSWGTAGVQDWFKNFGGGTGNLANPGGALTITETSATAGTGAAWSDGFNTIRDVAPFTSGCCGGLDLTGLSSLEFDIGQSGSNPVNVQFFTQASPGSNYVALGPDVAVAPGMGTYSLSLAGLSADQRAYMRTIGVNIRDHLSDGNLTWTINEIRSAGTPPTSRTIADHDGGATDFDGLICNFDCGAIVGGNGGQNNSGMSIVGGAAQWTDLGGGAGAAVTWGNGTQNDGGSFNARPVDLSNYNFVTVRMSATGAEPSVGVQFYMQTGSGFTYRSANAMLTVDGNFYDLVFPLSGLAPPPTAADLSFTDTNGINLFNHNSDLVIRVDSVVYTMVPEPATATLIGFAVMVGGLGIGRQGYRFG